MLPSLGAVLGLSNGLALTPPMGFNSYMAPQSGEKGLWQIGDFLVASGLRAAGCNSHGAQTKATPDCDSFD